ncbi:MAG: hypothetical protein DRJ97_04975 [Thermoprotei archaeon]|nr:MAG: hypothetical protein DRJ97_04975 [Thermoprotei archaeon]
MNMGSGEATVVLTRNVGEYRRAARRLLEPGGRVLEVGCGFGRTVEVLAKSGYVVLGVDKSPEAVEEAKRRLGELKGAYVEVADGFDVRSVLDLVKRYLGEADLVMIDVGGVEDPGRVLSLARTYLKALKPRILVVKNRLLYGFVERCVLYKERFK